MQTMSGVLLVFACLDLVKHTRMLPTTTPITTASMTTTATDMPTATTGSPDCAVGDGVGVVLSGIGVTSADCVFFCIQEESKKPAHGGC